MTTDYLEKQLENWKRLLLIISGASVTFLSTSIADIPNYSTPHFPGWFAIWLVLQLGSVPAGFLLLVGRSWRVLPLSDRLNTAFGYLSIAWVVLLALGVRFITMTPEASSSIAFLMISLGVLLGAVYLLLRRAGVNTPEEMFP